MSAEPAGGAVAESLPAAPARPRAGARTRRLPLFALSVIGAFVLCALLANVLSPADPEEQSLRQRFTPPVWEERGTWKHVLGTDRLGRDLLSRIIWGSRIVLIISPLATLCAYIVGCAMGLFAGYYRGWVDMVLMQVCNVILSFPVLVLYVIIVMKFGPSPVNIVVAVTFVASPQVARLVRSQTLELREREYVAAAKMRGEPAWYIMLVEILPNARGPLIVDACLRMGYTTIAIGVLGFLGLGLPPPDPDWGGMVKEAYGMIFVWPHMTLIPAFAISSIVIGANFLANGLREAGLDA